MACALSRLGLSVIASATSGGAGDGIQPDSTERLVLLGVVVSHAAIAAVLARQDLSAGERLVAFSLASFADREQRAFAGTAAAAARSGLGKSRYLEAREQLVRRGLLNVERRAGGRGQSATVRLAFAASGPWWDGDVNAQLLEAVLGYSGVRGPARLLLAALAALADGDGVVEGVCTEELRVAAGLADSTYRRARAALLASAEVALAEDGGGRGKDELLAGPPSCRARAATHPAPRPQKRAAAGREAARRHGRSRYRRDRWRGQGRRGGGRTGTHAPGRRSARTYAGRRCKGSGRERGFWRKGSGPERGFWRKGSGPERGFRRKPRQYPARNPATLRARGVERLEPHNPGPPLPP
jgi:hypothetical protein